MSEIVIIAAVARNRVIGKDNRLLWNIPEDMAHFKALTAGLLEATAYSGHTHGDAAVRAVVGDAAQGLEERVPADDLTRA